MPDKKTRFSIAATNLALLSIIIPVFSSKISLYLTFLYTLIGLFLLNTILLVYYNQKEYLFELLSRRISIVDLLNDKKIKSEFYDKSYNIILLTIIFVTIVHHYVHDLLLSSSQIKLGLLTLVYTMLVVFGFLLSKLGSLKMKILNEKLKYRKLSETFICLDCKKRIEIHDRSGHSSTILIDYKLLAIKDYDGKDIMADIKFDGELELIGYFNCKPDLEKENNYVFRPNRDDIKEGDVINFSYAFSGKDIFTQDTEYWSLNFKRYTKNCTLEIVFPKGRQVRNLSCKPCDESISPDRETYKPVLFKKYKRYTAYYHIQDFDKKECYKVTWDW